VVITPSDPETVTARLTHTTKRVWSMSTSRLSNRVTREINAAGGAAVWAEVMTLAKLPNIVADLGQGFPEDLVPPCARSATISAIEISKMNQYSPIPGLPRLSASVVSQTIYILIL